MQNKTCSVLIPKLATQLSLYYITLLIGSSVRRPSVNLLPVSHVHSVWVMQISLDLSKVIQVSTSRHEVMPHPCLIATLVMVLVQAMPSMPWHTHDASNTMNIHENFHAVSACLNDSSAGVLSKDAERKERGRRCKYASHEWYRSMVSVTP